MKRRLVTLAVVAFALWPLLHRGLVAAYDVDPWKLAGWAMYTAPRTAVRVQLAELSQDKALPFPADLSPAIRDALFHYQLRRQALGRLASPDALARIALREHPELEGVVVIVRAIRVDRESAMSRETIETDVLERADLRP